MSFASLLHVSFVQWTIKEAEIFFFFSVRLPLYKITTENLHL